MFILMQNQNYDFERMDEDEIDESVLLWV